MPGLSSYLKKKLLDRHFGGQTFNVPSLYAALFTTVPNEGGSGGTEVSGGSYARVSVTNNNTEWPDATLGTGVKTNANAIAFPAATADWGTVKGVGIYDASSGGNLLCVCSITNQAVVSGQTPTIPAGQLQITLE